MSEEELLAWSCLGDHTWTGPEVPLRQDRCVPHLPQTEQGVSPPHSVTEQASTTPGQGDLPPPPNMPRRWWKTFLFIMCVQNDFSLNIIVQC